MFFAFYAEIQDGHPKKWRESDFCKMSPVHSADTLQVQNFVEIALSHCFQDECAFALYAEMQEGCQKWRESDFCEKVASRLCIYPVGQKNFIEITLSRTISEISVFNISRRNDGCQKYTLDTLGIENFDKITFAQYQ